MTIRTLVIAMALFAFSCDQKSNDAMNKGDITSPSFDAGANEAIDALQASPANFNLLLENQYVRVLEYTLNPGEKDQMHTHPAKSSYIVSGGMVRVYLENGDTIREEEKAGTATWMDAVGKHYVENVGNTPIKVILTEIK